MIDHNFEKRLTSTKVFYGYLSDLIGNFKAVKSAKNRLDEQFQNKILLSVTQVNGCRYCSYLHTKHALESGMSEEEITSLLAGEVGDISNEESVALIFAQHYAETQANPDVESVQRLFDTYGEEKANDIIGIIQGIMFGNIHGISVDLLQSRVKGKSDPDSSFWTEFSTAFGVLLFVPYLGLKKLFGLLNPRAIHRKEIKDV
ncbi:MAG: Alkyl hydroperoxide reductase AhpD [uncultured Sulfurovum sp.]|uniref:Alkyl hydroperoxide reductase AhpD n=1 Tax=uncultured Sulfurovum sp. TaxID=269237 RepID=A0A6S6T9N6_9BACT|nr:MAG: Alkyl hydroperoxide reductase AhpD [uncultured Sulfurovum sp.]